MLQVQSNVLQYPDLDILDSQVHNAHTQASHYHPKHELNHKVIHPSKHESLYLIALKPYTNTLDTLLTPNSLTRIIIALHPGIRYIQSLFHFILNRTMTIFNFNTCHSAIDNKHMRIRMSNIHLKYNIYIR